MVSAADKPAEADLLWEKNIVPWLISQADKFKWLHQEKSAPQEENDLS